MSREKNLKLLKKFINKGRLNWDYGDDSWDGEKGEGETTLGILLDFILNRKFGNKEAEISFEQLKKYFKEDESYQAVFNVESGEF